MNRFIFVTLSAVCLAVPATAHAAESFEGCRHEVTSLPAVLSSQGVWCLKGDLATSITTGPAITIAANNVTLDCNGFKLGGLAAGASTQAYGVEIAGRGGAAVRRCNIRGFIFGVFANGGRGAIVEDNLFEGNTVAGVTTVNTPGVVIRRNLITDTGGSTSDTGAAGIVTWGEAHVIDNIISGVAGNGIGANIVYGIQANEAEGTFTGNRIAGLLPDGAVPTVGISVDDANGAIIAGNLINGEGIAESRGIDCDSTLAVARDNTFMRVDEGVTGCASVGNHVGTD